MAGATAVAVAAAGAVMGAAHADDLHTSSVARAAVLTPGDSAPVQLDRGMSDAASGAAPMDARAARGRARDLLRTRMAAVDAQAAAAQLAALHRACKYDPAVQRVPDHNATQLHNARTIVDVARQLGLPPRAAVIAVATAQQESELVNMRSGDRDSAGLFQQRPSMGWGTRAQVRNPVYAAKQFYYALEAVPGWQHLPLTVAAQTVEQSAFGWAYARWEQSAADLVAQLTGAAAADLNCSPR